jgi:uncharacterized protein (DUF302 family)
MQTFARTVPTDLTATKAHLADALQAQGFGILTEVDLAATFDAKLGEAHEGHTILGVCNPRLAKDALEVDRDVALLLPCTATLRSVDGGTEVRILSPASAFELLDADVRERLAGLGDDATRRLGAALDALEGDAAA